MGCAHFGVDPRRCKLQRGFASGGSSRASTACIGTLDLGLFGKTSSLFLLVARAAHCLRPLVFAYFGRAACVLTCASSSSRHSMQTCKISAQEVPMSKSYDMTKFS